MQITINTADRGPRAFVAIVTGRDAQYKFSRRFLTLADAGNRMNCYADKMTVEDVPLGSIVQTRVTNYKGLPTNTYKRVTAEGLVTITEADVYAALGE